MGGVSPGGGLFPGGGGVYPGGGGVSPDALSHIRTNVQIVTPMTAMIKSAMVANKNP